MNKINPERVKQFWRERADLYGKVPVENIVLFKDSAESKERDTLLKEKIESEMNPNKDRKILDMGCGTGRISLFLAPKAEYVIGVDYTKKLIDIAEKEKRKQKIENAFFLNDNCKTFRYQDKFDMAVICGVLLYLNDEEVEQFIRNTVHHIKKDGKIIVKEPVGVKGRFELINKYVQELGTKYNSIYRIKEDIINSFEKRHCSCVSSEKFYQHREETAVWFFVFIKE